MMDADQIEKALRENGALGALADTPEGRALSARFDERTLRDAVRRGDTEAMRDIVKSVLSTPEGKRLAEKVRKAAGKP